MKQRIILSLLLTLINSLSANPAANEIQLEKNLKIVEITPEIFVAEHSYPWPANSLIVNLNKNNLLLIDTPYTVPATVSLLDWLEEKFPLKVITAINTGFHIDNLGGNQALLDKNISILGSDRTVELIDSRGRESIDLFLNWLQRPKLKEFRAYYEDFSYVKPDRIFSLTEGRVLSLHGDSVEIFFPGETHSPDNVVVYIEKYKLLFGGCMILSQDIVGNTADANVMEWPLSLEKLDRFEIETVIPGHGLLFTPELIQNTIKTLRNNIYK